MNKHPRLAKYFVARGMFKESPMVVFDIGARGGFPNIWRSIYGNQVVLIGFEADVTEATKLSVYPIALYSDENEHTMYLTKYKASSSLYRPDPVYCRRWNADNLEVLKEEKVQTKRLDSLNLPPADVIKLDTEGTELDILKGGISYLKRVMAVSIEVEFLKVHEHQPIFGEIDVFMQGNGFNLYELSTRYISKNRTIKDCRGQIIWAQALYMRKLEDILTWRETDKFKMVSLFEIFGQIDSAEELLNLMELPNDDLKVYLNLLIDNTNHNNWQKAMQRFKRIRRGIGIIINEGER